MGRFNTILPAALCWCIANIGCAQEATLAGNWVVGGAVSTGISSDVGWDAAGRLEGKTIVVADGKLTLPDQTECAMDRPVAEVRHDDMWSFGSAGGSWADLGLVPTGIDYPVEVLALVCARDADAPIELIVQSSDGVVLLDVGDGVYVPLHLAPST
ncbi:MAG: hypothetical protein R3D56_01335 [Paracoccaceae bacterium]